MSLSTDPTNKENWRTFIAQLPQKYPSEIRYIITRASKFYLHDLLSVLEKIHANRTRSCWLGVYHIVFIPFISICCITALIVRKMMIIAYLLFVSTGLYLIIYKEFKGYPQKFFGFETYFDGFKAFEEHIQEITNLLSTYDENMNKIPGSVS